MNTIVSSAIKVLKGSPKIVDLNRAADELNRVAMSRSADRKDQAAAHYLLALIKIKYPRTSFFTSSSFHLANCLTYQKDFNPDDINKQLSGTELLLTKQHFDEKKVDNKIEYLLSKNPYFRNLFGLTEREPVRSASGPIESEYTSEKGDVRESRSASSVDRSGKSKGFGKG